MRTLQRDQPGGVVTFAGSFPGGNTNGSGVSQGVPWTFARLSTGDYTISFDTSLIPVSVLASGSAGYMGSPVGTAPGTARVQTISGGGALGNSTTVYFSITARRT